MADLYQLFARLGLDNSGFKQGVRDSISDLGQFESATESTANRMSTIGAKLMGAIGFGAIGAGALAAAKHFEDAGVNIQRATGATGEKLAGLEESFKNVYTQTAKSADQVSAALGLISTRTGQTGTALEALTLASLKLANVHKEDVATIVTAETQMFGAWNIATDKQAASVDYLRVVSQQTGAQVSSLTGVVTTQAPMLKQLGYSWEQATALVGKFDQTGVLAQGGFNALKKVIATFAKEGITDFAAAWAKLEKGVQDGTVSLAEFQKVAGMRGSIPLFDAIKSHNADVKEVTDNYVKLRDKGVDSVNTLGEALTIHLLRPMEALVASHKDLIVTIGMATPAWMALGGLVSPLIAGWVKNLFSASAAVVTLEGSTLALGGTFTSVGATASAAGVASSVGWVSALGAVGVAAAGALAIVAALAYAVAKLSPGKSWVSTDNASNSSPDYSKFPKVSSVPLWHSTNTSVNQPPPPSPPPVPVPPPAYLQATNMQQLVDIETQNEMQSSLGKTVKILSQSQQAGEDWGKKLEYISTGTYTATTASDKMNAALAALPANFKSGDTAVMGLSDSLWDAANAQDLLARNTAITEEDEKRFGVTSTETWNQIATDSKNAYDRLEASGKYSYDELTRAHLEMERDIVNSEHESGELTEEEWRTHLANIKGMLDDLADKAPKAAQKVASGMSEIARQMESVFGSLGTALADIAFDTKSIGSAFKTLGENIVKIIIEDVVRYAIGSLLVALTQTGSMLNTIGQKLKDILGNAGGGAASTAGTAAGGATSAAGSTAGAVGGAVGSGLMGTIGAIASVGTMISSIIGNFQSAKQETTLNAIESNTRYAELYLGGRADQGILGILFTINSSLQFGTIVHALEDFRNKWFDWSGTSGAGSGSAGGGKGGLTVNFTGCTFSATTPQAIAQAMFNQAALVGALG